MANPFNYEKPKSKAGKAELSREFRERALRIDKLTIARQWSLIGLAVYSLIQLVLLAFGWLHFFSDASLLVSGLGLLASFGFLDQQIKHLKALQNAMVFQRIDP